MNNIESVKNLIMEKLNSKPAGKRLMLNEIFPVIQKLNIAEEEVKTALEELKGEGLISIIDLRGIFWQLLIQKP